MASFAQYDSSPIVRRRMVRELDDIELVRRIAENDEDRSVRESCYLDNKQKEFHFTIAGAEPKPEPDTEPDEVQPQPDHRRPVPDTSAGITMAGTHAMYYTGSNR